MTPTTSTRSDRGRRSRRWPRCATRAGFTLRERLTLYPEYVRAWLGGAPWLDPRLAPHVLALADPATGLAVESARPTGKPWQEPDPVLGTGRIDLHATIDTTGRTADRRGDFDTVYGDWAEVAEHAVLDLGAPRRRAAPPTCAAGAAAGRRRPGRAARPGHEDLALALFERRRRRRWTRWSAWPTTSAGTRSATTSRTW